MECPYCGQGSFEEGKIDVAENLDGQRVLVKDVPALICSECGEHAYLPGVVDRLNGLIRASLDDGIEIVVRRYVSPPLLEAKSA